MEEEEEEEEEEDEGEERAGEEGRGYTVNSPLQDTVKTIYTIKVTSILANLASHPFGSQQSFCLLISFNVGDACQ